MIILLSPAKTLDESPVGTDKPSATDPHFPVDTERLVAVLRGLKPDKLKAVLKDVSVAIASLNVERYKAFDAQPAKQCVLAYDGPAYKGLQASTLSSEQLVFAQQHLRILSGLYGLLRPLDAIKPYRLDMGCKVACGECKDLYALWSGKVTALLNEELAATAAEHGNAAAFIVNVASQEYFKVVDTKALRYPIFTISFPGPSVYAKQARGLMARYIITQGITQPAGLKGFTGHSGEYRFAEAQSSDHELVFVRVAAKAGDTGKAGAGKASAAAKPEGLKRKAASGAACAKAGGDDDDDGKSKDVKIEKKKEEEAEHGQGLRGSQGKTAGRAQNTRTARMAGKCSRADGEGQEEQEQGRKGDDKAVNGRGGNRATKRSRS